MKIRIGFIAFLLAGMLSCSGQSEHSISVEQLNQKINSDSSNYVLVDVRNPDELTGPLGKIDGVINIPLPELEDRQGELEEYKDKEIIFICRSGRRSGIAADKFAEKGYKAYSLEGGMIEYGKQTEKK